MAKRGRVIVHIGPPKTATTALQYLLQSFGPSLFYYGGVCQPRATDSSDLARRLHAFCSQIDEDAGELLEDMSHILNAGRDIVISEEMFLVDGTVPHQEKLQKLNSVLRGFDLTIIACVRDPVAALRSLYRELFANLVLTEKLSFKRFLRSNQARVFDYKSLDLTLRNAGFENVKYIDFDVLVGGELSLASVLGPGYPPEHRLVPDKVNVGAVSKSDSKQVKDFSLQHALGWRNAPPIFLLNRPRQLKVSPALATRLRTEATKLCSRASS